MVIEGTSAAGKTTWCQTHASALHVPEEPPGRERWRMAVEIERAHGLAVCDTDPAKLYYDFALWRTGRLGSDEWEASVAQTRSAFAADELGLPDLTYFAERDRETLDRHRASDRDRRRHRFELHVELQPFFKEWWEAVEAIEPGRVFWHFPNDIDELYEHMPRVRRTGADLLDLVLDNLRGRGTSHAESVL